MSDFLLIGVDPSDALRMLEDSLRHLPIAMTKARQESLERLRDDIRAGTPRDTGHAQESIDIEGEGSPYEGAVVSHELYVLVLEEGRTPGAAPPPAQALIPWLQRKGIDPDLAFVIARAIGHRGTPAHHMFSKAYERAGQYVPSIYEGHIL